MSSKKCYNLLILAFVFFFLGLLTEKNILFPRFDESYVRRFQKVFTKKENEMLQIMNLASKSLAVRFRVHPYEPEISSDNNNLLENGGLSLFIYQNDTIRYWSESSVPVASTFSKSKLDSTSFIYIGNAWYVSKIRKVDKTTIVGLILIKQVYQYDNKLLKTGFQGDFNYPSSVKISSKPLPNSFPIVNYKNQYLFSLVFDKSANHPLFELYFPTLFYGLFFIFLLLFICQLIHSIRRTSRKYLAISLFVILGFALRYFFSKLEIPSVIYKTDLFNPFVFAASDFFPSLGELFLWTILIFFLSFSIFRDYNISVYIRKVSSNVRLKFALLFIHIFVVSGSFFWVFNLLKSIILNSSFSFEINNVISFNVNSIISYIILIMLYISFSFIVDNIIRQFDKILRLSELMLVAAISCLVLVIVFLCTGHTIHILSFIILWAIVFVIGKAHIGRQTGYNYSKLVIITFLFAINTVYYVATYSKMKDENVRKVYLLNLANENDRICEFLLNDRIQNQLKSDSIVQAIIFNGYLDINQLYNHLKGKYFNSYFDKYNLQVTVCSESDSVYLDPPEGVWQHCYGYFKKTIDESGSRIFNTDFYFVDYYDGLVNYLGWMKYKDPRKGEVSLFIELSSKLISEQLGYPALLLDEKISYQLLPKTYSYAKYYKGQLISQFGSHTYNLTPKVFEQAKRDFGIVTINHISHMVYRPNKDTLIVLSYNATSFFDWVISFSYTFLLFFILMNILLMFVNFNLIKQLFFPSFKNKIQLVMIAFLFPSLLIIGGVALYLNIRQHYNKNIEIISEKLQSIYIEMSNKLGHEERIKPDWYSYPYGNLNELLIRFSNVFYIDINLYDTNGFLIATSRPEIFEKGLIGDRINPKAYKNIEYDMMSKVVKTEEIGTMKYFSAYVPFKNDNNKLIAFLNVPYFTRQDEFTAEVSRMIITVSNVFVLLFLFTSVLAIFISQKITLPLTEIQQRFSRIKLGQKYEKIQYDSPDEIGDLVNEYNRMVSELEKSVELLAKSERESAWKEMAKQIAHEINNPLTPMKLSVQHMQRAWVNKRDTFEASFERICKTLIEEIDNLSSIATEFSNFAKMPTAMEEKLNLVEKIKNVVSLFSSNEVCFDVNLHNIEYAWISADKEQISRVLINLVKNAIQAVDKGVMPKIIINLDLSNTHVLLSIRDNGRGIADDIKDKLFRPNFTTKTSGMGLGLAIVKNIIESAGGIITFDTKENDGTVFFIEMPLVLTDK